MGASMNVGNRLPSG